MFQTLDRAYRGESVVVTELNVPLRRGGKAEVEDAWFNCALEPLRTPDGAVVGSMVVAIEATEQVQGRLKLEALRAEAEAANRAKDEFLAILGHELRNPLAPIVTALQLLRLRGLAGGEREREVIERQVQHLLRLVDDLLDVARVARGKHRAAPQAGGSGGGDRERRGAGQPAPRGEAAIPRHRGEEAARGGRRPGSPAPGDREPRHQRRQVHASRRPHRHRRGARGRRGAGGREGRRHRDRSRVSSRIFESFVQGERGIDRGQGGLGLGLAICKSLISLHGGRIEARSEGLGKGSTFSFWVAAAKEDVERRSEERVVRREPPERVRRVLVVDDNEDAAFMLSEAIRSFGHEVHTTYDGPSALEAAIRFRPHVALLDSGFR